MVLLLISGLALALLILALRDAAQRKRRSKGDLTYAYLGGGDGGGSDSGGGGGGGCDGGG